MVLNRRTMHKGLMKGRVKALELMNRLANAGGLPRPTFDYAYHGRKKQRSHFFQVRFQLPEFIRNDKDFNFPDIKVMGAGRSKQKGMAKSMAALEVIQRIEEAYGMDFDRKQAPPKPGDRPGALKRPGPGAKVAEILRKFEETGGSQEENTLIARLKNLPVDPAFPESTPGGRRGVIDFSPDLIIHNKAFAAAKALTLAAKDMPPRMVYHSQQLDSGERQQWAEIPSVGKFAGVTGPKDERSYYSDKRTAEILALEQMYDTLDDSTRDLVSNQKSTFGMAKMFVKLPEDQLRGLQELVELVESPRPPRISTSYDDESESEPEDEEAASEADDDEEIVTNEDMSTVVQESTKIEVSEVDALHENEEVPEDTESAAPWNDEEAMLARRVEALRATREKLTLPIDSFDEKIPHDSPVAIVRGGIGTGKTSRYPVMLSLLSPTGPATKVLVALPNYQTCQGSARRVAYEQGFSIGSPECPIGCAIRMETYRPSSQRRTIDYQTPNVILSRAMEDPLLQEVTHLCIDDVHRRNVDMDMLLALAKQVSLKRRNHPTLPPLRVVILSDGLDATDWHSYFGVCMDDDAEITVVDVPDVQRSPVEIIHLGNEGFPMHIKSMRSLLHKFKYGDVGKVGDYDEAVCEAAAKLVTELIMEDGCVRGSYIIFLPGIEEIRLVDSMVRGKIKKRIKKGRIEGPYPDIVKLYPVLNAAEQARAFAPGPKIILSAVIVDVPDVDVVVDSGREKRFANVESATEEGLQLGIVDISKAAAEQRAARAGNGTAGRCYRLYGDHKLQKNFEEHSKPEMPKKELTKLVSHALSIANSGSSLQLLLDAPDPPNAAHLERKLMEMSHSGLIDFDPNDRESTRLTPMGRVCNLLPVTPRIGRMILTGLALRAVDCALEFAALLSVPKVFTPQTRKDRIKADFVRGIDSEHYSDLIKIQELYHRWLEKDNKARASDNLHLEFQEASILQSQLEQRLMLALNYSRGMDAEADWALWNVNGDRIAARISLMCSSLHLAHLVSGRTEFATTEYSNWPMHPESINNRAQRRCHWYLYSKHKLYNPHTPKDRDFDPTFKPYTCIHLTTAVSPLEVGLFAPSSPVRVNHSEDTEVSMPEDEGLFVIDKWVPVCVPDEKQRYLFLTLRNLLTKEMLNQIADDPVSILGDSNYEKLVWAVLTAVERQRVGKRPEDSKPKVSSSSQKKT